MSDRFWKTVFNIAAVLTGGAGLGWLIAPEATLVMGGASPLPDYLFVRIAGIAVFAFGIGYALVARNLGLREIVWLGVIGKGLVVVLFFFYLLAGALSPIQLAIPLADAMMVALFLLFLLTRRNTA